MQSPQDKTYLFEQMPVAQAVRRQILPSIASQMVLLLYNLADTYFVGLLNDPAQTASVSVAYTVTVLMTAIANLFAVGGASCMARAMGQHQDDRAGQISSVSFWWCLISAVLFSGVFFLLRSPLLHLCGATDATYSIVEGYTRWVVVWGGPCAIINIQLANLLRAQGSALAASLGVSLGGVVNILLDPFFVLPQFLGLGARGAGLATALSGGVGTVFLLICILARPGVVSLRSENLRYTRKHIGRILQIGFPSCVQYLLTMIALGALMKFMSAYDTDALAALGIVKKLDMLPLYFAIGVGFALVCVAIYELFAPTLVSVFIDTPDTIAYGAVFLRIMVLAMPMMAVCYPMITQFQAMGRVKESLICSVLRKGALDIPLLFLLDGLVPLYGCTMVQPVADCVSMIVSLCLYRRVQRQMQKP